jgi:hypothetical protein
LKPSQFWREHTSWYFYASFGALLPYRVHLVLAHGWLFFAQTSKCFLKSSGQTAVEDVAASLAGTAAFDESLGF